MSLDLYQQESSERLARFEPVHEPEASAFDGFMRGAGLTAMKNLARAGRTVDMAGAIGPVVKDAISGGTELQDRYFREHDEVWGSAVDYWTPKPNEVGVAGQITGELLTMLPMVIASPSFAAGETILGGAEDLMKKGVDWKPALGSGVAQGVGLGVGIWMPILGQNLWQRVVIGGALGNVGQGVATRAASQVILEGTPAAKEFEAFDGQNMTLDALMGAAFGGVVHLSPRARAQSAEAWDRVTAWAENLTPTQKAAIVALRLAQHLNVDSTPGLPATAADVEAHANRVRTAIEQLERDMPVEVGGLEAGRFEPQPERLAEMARRAEELTRTGARVGKAEGVEPAVAAPLKIDYNRALDPEMAGVEKRFADAILGDVDAAVKAYEKMPATEGGKIINTDLARELSPDYAASLDSRSRYAAAVHEPASALVKEIYRRRLAMAPKASELPMVSFTAGGTGAGKTGAIAGTPLAAKIAQVSQIVYDANLNGFKSAAEKIDMALAAGKRVNIMWVGRDPIEALKGAIKRAIKIGRTVPLHEHAKTHMGSAAVVERLAERYRGRDDVQFVYLDNAGAKGEVTIAGPELPRSYNFDNLEARLKETLDAEYKKGSVPDPIYRGFAGHDAGAGGELPGRAGEGQPAGEHAAVQGGREAGTAVTESKAPAVTRGEAEPPPPRGSRGGEAAGAEGTDPVRAAADLIAAQNPERVVRMGTNADGTPRVISVKEYLQEARDAVKQAAEDSKLFEVAATCLFGKGG